MWFIIQPAAVKFCITIFQYPKRSDSDDEHTYFKLHNLLTA